MPYVLSYGVTTNSAAIGVREVNSIIVKAYGVVMDVASVRPINFDSSALVGG